MEKNNNKKHTILQPHIVSYSRGAVEACAEQILQADISVIMHERRKERESECGITYSALSTDCIETDWSAVCVCVISATCPECDSHLTKGRRQNPLLLPSLISLFCSVPLRQQKAVREQCRTAVSLH